MNLADVIKSLRGKRFAITGRNNYPIELFHGEKLFLNREPSNNSDPNAIAVLNTNSRVVGHLKRKEAARIAPHIDSTQLALRKPWLKHHMTTGKHLLLLILKNLIYVIILLDWNKNFIPIRKHGGSGA